MERIRCLRGAALDNNKEFTQAIFYELLDYIDSILPGKITLEELQRKSGYSKRHVSRLFVTYTGVAPYEYIKIMQAYRMFLELRFTKISVEKICEKYNRIDVQYFKKNTLPLIEGDPVEAGVSKGVNFKHIITNKKLILPKKYLSCSFVSLFDYEIQARGIKHTILRTGDSLMSSHYHQIENIINNFCEKYAFHRDHVWACAKFSPFDTEHYDIGLYTCVTGDPTVLPEGEQLSLQGDYLCFSWAGYPEDTFSNVRNFYDVFFFQFLATRKDGFDIIKRQKINDINNYYIFTYFIPVVIDEAILAIKS
jgi:AraC-like DNA-binding protein